MAISSFDRTSANITGQNVALIDKQRKADAKVVYGKKPCSKVKAKKNLF